MNFSEGGVESISLIISLKIAPLSFGPEIKAQIGVSEHVLEKVKVALN